MLRPSVWDRGARRDHAPGEVERDRAAQVRNALEADATRLVGVRQFDRDQHDRLDGTATALAATRWRAEIRLVQLDQVVQQLPIGPNHCPPQLVQKRPGGSIAAEPERALQPERADPTLLVGHVPGRREPRLQIDLRAIEDRAGQQPLLPTACSAAQGAIAHPPERSTTTGRADWALRPAQPLQVGSTGRLIREPATHLRPIPRIITTSDKTYPDH